MKNLFDIGNNYAKNSDWIDFALTKLCLCSLGVLIGIRVSEKNKKLAAGLAGATFAASYMPLIKRLIKNTKKM